MSKTGRTWKRADKIVLETAVNRVKCGEDINNVAKSLGLSYGQVYRASRFVNVPCPPNTMPMWNTGEESNA